MISAGRRADLAMLSNLHDVTVDAVYVNGRRVAAQGSMIEAPRPASAAPTGNTMKLPLLTTDDVRVCIPGLRNGRATIRTIKGARFNSWSEREVEVRDGYAVVPPDVSVMTVAHRHGLSNLKPQTAIIEGWDRWGGAFATSYSHDFHNLIIYGHDPQEMVLAGNTVIGMGGGNAVVKDGRVIAKIAYPVAGMLSLDDPAEVSRLHGEIVEAAGRICAGSLLTARSKRSAGNPWPAIRGRILRISALPTVAPKKFVRWWCVLTRAC